MQLKQFRYSEDNLGYLVYSDTQAAAVDGGAVEDILSFLDEKNLELKYVLNTHTHPDHTVGNRALLSATGARHISIPDLMEKWVVKLEGHEIRIFHTPGHSEDSIVFFYKGTLLSGDTLLTGKAGRCFTGDLEGFLRSIKLILTLPHETAIYGGHDYVEEYMGAAREIEPGNIHIAPFLASYDPGHVVSTLETELKINPTLRFNNEIIISVLQSRGLPCETELERWKSVMSIV